MKFSEKLKAKRKEFGMSQEQLAEKINVSRQAITKWETGSGMPDIENMLAIASLFNTTVDELLSSEKQLQDSPDFFHESTIGYDIDSSKHYDVNIGGAHEVFLDSNDTEKLHVRLASNTITSLENLFKVKIDDGKNNVDVDIHRNDELTEAQAKEALYVFISVPAKFVSGVEIATHTQTLKLSSIEAEMIEIDGKINHVHLSDVRSFVELSSSNDMIVVCDDINGGIGINQISATSTVHVPQGAAYQVKKKGLSNRVSYTLDGQASEAPTNGEAPNSIKLSGLNMELVINEYTDVSKIS